MHLSKFLLFSLFTLLLLATTNISRADDSSILETTHTTSNSDLEEVPDETVEDFSFIDMAGKKHEFKEYRGKWVIVNYWAVYCPPCRIEVTDIDMFARANKDKVVVLGMDAGGSPHSELKRFKKEFNLSYQLIPAQENTLLAFGIVDAIPTTFIVSPKGELVGKHVGLITYDDMDYFVHPPVFEKKHN